MPLPNLCNMLALVSLGLVSTLFVDEPVSLFAIALVAFSISAILYQFANSVRFHIEIQPPSLFHRQRTLHLQVATVAFALSQAALAALVLHALASGTAVADAMPSLIALIVVGECCAAWFHWAAFIFKRPPRIPVMPAVA